MNTHMGVELGISYWRILIGFWVWHYINIFYDRFVLIKDALNRHPDIHTAVLDRDCFITPRNMTEYFELSAGRNCDHYNLQLFSCIFPAFSKNYQTVNISYQRSKPAKTYHRRIKETLADCLSFANRRRSEILLHGQIPPYSILKLMGLSFGKIGFLGKEFRYEKVPMPDFTVGPRADFGLIESDNEFEKILFDSFRYHFPVIYLEKFKDARHAVLEYIDGKPPRVFCSSGGLLISEFGKYFAAEALEKGSKLINIQHGGNYGINFFHQYERHELETAHRFYCWGWAGRDMKESLSNAPMLKDWKIKRSAKQKRDRRIVFVATSHSRYLYRPD